MDTFYAIADPTRRSIIEMLAANGQLSAGEIGQAFNSSAPAISQHLKVLREAGLVQMEKQAQQRIYRLDPEGLEAMEQWLAELRRFWSTSLDQLERLLREEQPKRETSKRTSR